MNRKWVMIGAIICILGVVGMIGKFAVESTRDSPPEESSDAISTSSFIISGVVALVGAFVAIAAYVSKKPDQTGHRQDLT